ncbi:MAG: response regulator [Acidimicrobiia bacterium]|nr:response regulator [Acidimicrobiia bacterium]
MSSRASSRVLLVDDDADMRGLLRAVLDASPTLEVVGEAHDGESALERAAIDRPDIVVLDLGLPDIAGRDVLTRLRALDAEIRVVIFTADEDARHEMQTLGAVDVVPKSDEIGRLVSVVEAVQARDPEMVASTHLAAERSSPIAARRFVVGFLAQRECDHLIDDAVLVVSELVTNAVVHARSTSDLTLHLRPGVLRIEVTDRGAGTPNPRSPGAHETGGRGLQIVSALAGAWGIDPTPAGKVVWVEMAT